MLTQVRPEDCRPIAAPAPTPGHDVTLSAEALRTVHDVLHRSSQALGVTVQFVRKVGDHLQEEQDRVEGCRTFVRSLLSTAQERA